MYYTKLYRNLTRRSARYGIDDGIHVVGIHGMHAIIIINNFRHATMLLILQKPLGRIWPCPRSGTILQRDQDGPDHRQRPVVTLLPLKYGSGGETLKPKVIVVGGGRMQVVPKRTTAVSLSAARALGMLWYPILKFLGRINELK